MELIFAFFIFAFVCAVILIIFQKKIYSRLSVRIALLILASGIVTFVMALAYNQITSDTLSTPWERILQISVVVLGGPIIIGVLAARFVRRPLRQFNEAVASLEQNNYKVQLKSSGIHEFDEVFTKFNNLIHRLQKEEKLRKDLVSDTSHELNTPLTTMIGQLTAIQEGKYPATEKRIASLKDQAELLAELVQQLNTYTKARIRDTAKPEKIHLREFCEELAEHFNVELKDEGMHLELQIPTDYIVTANRGALQQIMTNLIQNTLRYSEATKIIIEATADKIQFSDNGKGVPPENLPYLFERFYRVEKSRNKTTGGLGLGLAIVKELAESQNWSIAVAASEPGLIFTINTRYSFIS